MQDLSGDLAMRLFMHTNGKKIWKQRLFFQIILRVIFEIR